MQNVIDLREARERRPRSNDYLKDGHYYKIIPLGTVVQASCEGHYSKAWVLWNPFERRELEVNESGEFYGDGVTVFTIKRNLLELTKAESEQAHKQAMAVMEQYNRSIKETKDDFDNSRFPF